MECLGIIPARLESTRLKNKVLIPIAGKPLIQRVWEQASKASKLQKALIASDSQEIISLAQGFGAQAILTSRSHISGTDRIAEAHLKLEASEGRRYQLVANIQGDMPFIQPSVIDAAVNALIESPADVGISTVATVIKSHSELVNPAAVKVVIDASGKALYFSRAAIPFRRDSQPVENPGGWGLKHIGLYVFRSAALQQFCSLPSCQIEQKEKLEQLRALFHGINIKVVVVPSSNSDPGIEIDTPEDLKRAEEYCARIRSTSSLLDN